MLTLSFCGAGTLGKGMVLAKRVRAEMSVALAGSIGITTGPMKGSYSLIAHPYAPGVDYNRILLRTTKPLGEYYLDANGLLFQGVDFSLNLWSKDGLEYTLYRSDGWRDAGRLTICQ